MTAALAVYLQVALALGVTGAGLWLATRLALPAIARAPDAWNRVAVGLLLASLVLPIGLALLPRADRGTGGAPLRVMAHDDGSASFSVTLPSALAPRQAEPMTLAPSASVGLAGVVAAGLLLALARLAARLIAAHRACQALPVVRVAGRVRIAASDAASAPFSLQVGRVAHVVVPTDFLARRDELAFALAHEGHHLRRGHSRAGLLVEIVGAVYFWAPLMRPWRAAFDEIHELASDACVLRRRAACASAYARSLVTTAGRAREPRLIASLTMAAPNAAALRRRLEMLFDRPAASRRSQILAAGACLASLALGTIAARAGVKLSSSARLDRGRLEALAARTPAGGLEIAVDDSIVGALESRLATPAGREATIAALARMPDHAPLMTSVLEARGLSSELLAVVLVESGFRVGVRPPPSSGFGSAGPWQFIPSTARKYGLTVTETEDERLEPRRSTEAAAALLFDLHERFGDWPLALQAYNQGSGAVEKAIAAGGTRDALELERRGLLSPYASHVLAAVLILRDPTLAG